MPPVPTALSTARYCLAPYTVSSDGTKLEKAQACNSPHPPTPFVSPAPVAPCRCPLRNHHHSGHITLQIVPLSVLTPLDPNLLEPEGVQHVASITRAHMLHHLVRCTHP